MKSVLIVDDEPIVRKLIRICLRGRYHTDEAENGEKALEKSTRRDYDCIITDVQMPRMDGLSLLVEIKRKNPRSRVIVMSGAREDMAEIAIRKGAYCFLPKPLVVDSIRAVLARV